MPISVSFLGCECCSQAVLVAEKMSSSHPEPSKRPGWGTAPRWAPGLWAVQVGAGVQPPDGLQGSGLCPALQRAQSCALPSLFPAGTRCRGPGGEAHCLFCGFLSGCDSFIQGETLASWTRAGAAAAADPPPQGQLCNWIRILFKCSFFAE